MGACECEMSVGIFPVAGCVCLPPRVYSTSRFVASGDLAHVLLLPMSDAVAGAVAVIEGCRRSCYAAQSLAPCGAEGHAEPPQIKLWRKAERYAHT